MQRLPAEPSSFMAGAPPVMYDGKWRGEEGLEWEAVEGGQRGATRVTAGRLMEWRGAVGAQDDGDDSLLLTVDADLWDQRRQRRASATPGRFVFDPLPVFCLDCLTLCMTVFRKVLIF